MKILLIYPKYVDTFWSFKHALKFASKKAAFPPLGLLTMAAMLPSEWQKKVIDMNVDKLTDKELKKADYVFISAMVVQWESSREVVDRCKKLGIKTVAGGPLFTLVPQEFPDVDHLVLDEAETTLAPFLEDLKNGCAKKMYRAPVDVWPDVAKTPIPMWELIKMKKYASMNVQYSRGCPFDCEFCNVTTLNGHRPRTKTAEQIIRELEVLYDRNWRGGVFIVDDNFIGNKIKLKKEVLPVIATWMKQKKHPFPLNTETSINLADDEELMNMMTDAGFNTVFIGIETTNEGSLEECHKVQNQKRDLGESVKIIQNHGMQVQAGFIVGFDSDPQSIFQEQIDFIQRTGIVTAMVGMLMAPPQTKLYRRMEKEGRIIPGGTGDNTDGTTNVIPKMGYEKLFNGYRKIVQTIYSPEQCYQRIKTFIKEYKPPRKDWGRKLPGLSDLKSLFHTTLILGIKEKERWVYWKLVIPTLFKRPRFLHLSITLMAYGYHFRKVADKLRHPPVPKMTPIQPATAKVGNEKSSQNVN